MLVTKSPLAFYSSPQPQKGQPLGLIVSPSFRITSFTNAAPSLFWSKHSGWENGFSRTILTTLCFQENERMCTWASVCPPLPLLHFSLSFLPKHDVCIADEADRIARSTNTRVDFLKVHRLPPTLHFTSLHGGFPTRNSSLFGNKTALLVEAWWFQLFDT